MAEADVTRFQLRRVNPFQGLMIDAVTWRDAHEYHRNQMRLHHLAMHGWGIVHGLEAQVADGDDGEANSIVVEPGIAIDPLGNVIVVTEPYRHRVEARAPGPVYLLLQFSEVPAGPLQTVNGGAGQATRVLEAYRIQQREALPDEPCLELARIDFNPERGRLAAPKDAGRPGRNELDTRHRTTVGTLPATAKLPSFPPPANAAGAASAAGEYPGAAPRPAPPPAAALGAAAAVPAASTTPDDAAERQTERHDAEAHPLPAQAASAIAPAERATVPVAPVPLPPGSAAAMAPTLPPFPLPPVMPPTPAPSPPVPPLTIAAVTHGSDAGDTRYDGVRYLAREVENATGRTVRVLDPLRLADAADVDLLYVTGQARLSLEDEEVAGLGRVLDRGGVVLGEGSADGPRGDAGAREFALSFAEAAMRLGRQLARVERGHPILVSRYVFSGPPAGARANTMVLEAGGMVYSDADYGRAWQGGTPERPLPRSAIRDATEFGVNVALFRNGATKLL